MKPIYPKNKEHFKKLIPFAKKILQLLKQNKIDFVIYSSYVTFFYTKDENLKVHDLDVLIKGKDFPRIIEILRRKKIKAKFLPEWDTLIIKKGKLKVDIDRMGKGCKDIEEGGLPKRYFKMNFYGIPSKIVTIKELYNTYLRGYKRTKEDKAKIRKKIKYLEKFMKR